MAGYNVMINQYLDKELKKQNGGTFNSSRIQGPLRW